MIPAEAVAAAREQLHEMGAEVPPKYVNSALEAALPFLLSHEREQTRIAHVDAMVNRETRRAEMAELWGDGYLAGLADMQNGQERPNPYRRSGVDQ